MKRLFAMFALTSREQRLVIFVMVALVVGAWVKHYREMQLEGGPQGGPEPALTSIVSPTPNER